MALTWEKHTVDGTFATEIRRGIRQHRREKGRGGHRFRYDDLKTLWGAKDRKGTYAVLTHNEDKLWQYWFKGEDGWKLQSWFKLLKDAQAEAEKPRPKPVVVPSKVEPGSYVHAAWTAPYRGRKPMVVRCQTDSTAAVISELFQKLGCTVEVKTVAA